MEQAITKVLPAFSKNDFLRAAWIALAKEDAPLEVFDGDFLEPSTTSRQFFEEFETYTISWQGEIGRDHQESYVDFEKYYEKIPYTDYERKYDSNKKEYVQVPVTKYRQEERQRQVTKYRTVTDWRSEQGNVDCSSLSVIEVANQNACTGSARVRRFFVDLPPHDEALLKKEGRVSVPEAVKNAARAEHVSNIHTELMRKLPGDHARNLSERVDSINGSTCTFYETVEYETSISFNGETYRKTAFPFGKMTMAGDEIENEESLDTLSAQIEERFRSELRDATSVVEKKYQKVSNLALLGSFLALVLSIIVSLTIPYLAVVIAAFALAGASFVISRIFAKKQKTKSDMLIKSIKQDSDKQRDEDLSSLEKTHLKTVLKKLNEKLASLNLEPATMDDIKEDI